MAGRGNPLVDEEKLKAAESRLEPNLRDEGAGFFSTLFTAGSNLGSDTLTELGYIAQAVARPIDTGEAVLRVLAGYTQKALPDDWEAYLPEDWAENKVYANAINEYYAEKYGSLEQAADSFAEQPVSVALDAFAVKALLTTISKQAAKKSVVTTKMAKQAEGTVMEGELASRAAAEARIVEELERTVKYEGPLVWDEAIGAHVPKASVTKPPKIDGAEVAPLIDDIERATPNDNPAIASVPKSELAQTAEDLKAAWLAGAREFFEGNTDGMMKTTRNSEVSPALADGAKIASETGTPIRVTADDIAYFEQVKRAEALGDDFEGIAGYFEPDQLRALEAATGTSVLDNATPRFSDPDLPFETIPVAAKASEIVNPGKASIDKLNRDRQRMADDDIMAAATQADLFENGSAAAYEAYQASQLANRATTAMAATPNGMMATSPSSKIAKLNNVEMRTTPPSIPRLTAKPESSKRPNKNLEINLARTLPAGQRVAAAASQTGLTGERDIDGSLMPMTPDKGIDIDKPESGLLEDMPPFEKSIDNRDISAGRDSGRPGWKYPQEFEGSTNEGNYLSADFEDEHWNTPSGVQEAITIWGRPVGNRRFGVR